MNAFFLGIGGMGMSGLAKILAQSNQPVAGSDRNLDGDYCKRLLALGVPIYPQDGTGPEIFMAKYGLKAEEAPQNHENSECGLPDIARNS